MTFGVIIGILLTIFVETILYLVYNLGKKNNNSKSIENVRNDRDIEKEKLFQQGFYNVVKDYDIDVAMGRREQY